MAVISRKQQEILDRERRILEVSRPLLLAQGYHGLNMDRLAELLNYSKGTIYNHFSCKEEIMIALAIQAMEQRTELFHRAATFRGRTRERMLAVGFACELFVKLFPDHFRIEQIIREGSFWDKTSEKRRFVMRSCEQRCTGTVGGIVMDAIAQGDIKHPGIVSGQVKPQDVVFGLWSQTYGALTIITTSEPLTELGISEPFQVLQQNLRTMLDGYQWMPLSMEHDYEATWQRVEREVFAEECRNGLRNL